MARDPIERFFEKVDKTNGCWLWTASLRNTGYGQFWDGKHLVSSHRFSYVLAKGPIPPDLEIDHLCRVRHCVNPDHLEAVTQNENLMRGENPAAKNKRKTHCIRGHEFAGSNLYIRPGTNHRFCRACRRAYMLRYNADA